MRRRLLMGVVLSLGLLSCNRILGIRPPERRPFEHRAHVLHGVACLQCHGGIVGAEDEAPLHIPGAQVCRSCHETPHDDGNCQNCHGLRETRRAVAEAREHIRFSHKNHIPRTRGNCVRCHVGVAGAGELLRPPMGACLSCHEHEDRFAVQDCGFCHENLVAEGVRPEGHIVHDGDWARQHGVRSSGAREVCATCHAERFCASCHGVTVPARTEQLTFDDPMRPGVHRGGFRSRHSEAARGDPGLCATCHATDFCAECHRDEGRAAGSGGAVSPHATGWLGLRGERNEHGPAAWRDPAVCAACHGGAGEALCIGCHRVGGVGGSPHSAGFREGGRSLMEPACRPCHQGGT